MTAITQLDFRLPKSNEFVDKLLGAWYSRFTSNVEVLVNNEYKTQVVFAISSSLQQDRFSDSFRSFEASLYFRRENPCLNVYKCRCKNCKWFFYVFRSKLAALNGIFHLPSCKSYNFITIDVNSNKRNILEEFKIELDTLITELEIVVCNTILNSSTHPAEDLL